MPKFRPSSGVWKSAKSRTAPTSITTGGCTAELITLRPQAAYSSGRPLRWDGFPEGGELSMTTPSDDLSFSSKVDSLGVGAALGFAAELLEENAIFLLEMINDRLLMAVHPTGNEAYSNRNL